MAHQIFLGRIDTSKAGGVFGLASEGEDIKVLEWPVDKFLAKLPELNDAKTIIAGYWLKENLANILRR